MKFIPVILLIVLLSCNSSRKSATTIQASDSTAYRMLDSVAQVNRVWAQEYEKLLQTKGVETIVFDTLVRDSIIDRVVFRDDGRIASAEGRIRSVTVVRDELRSENGKLKDSLQEYKRRLASDSVTVREVVKVQTVNKRTVVFPWYFWLLLIPAALAGWYIRTKFK